ncbi:DUF6941 family protein [Arthrobacter sp. TMS1-12-1]
MADLDYAFLAEFAKVEGNKLTAVGASYTHVQVPSLPSQHLVYVAGRIRAPEGSDAPQVTIRYVSADEAVEIALEASLTVEHARPYAGRIGLTFAMGFGVPLSAEGLHNVYIQLDGTDVRHLAFTVVQGEDG